MMIENILKDFEQSTVDLLQTLSSFTDEQFNHVPFDGSWSAGQVAEHLYKSESNAVRVMQGNTGMTRGRKPDANEEAFRLSFLNFDIKFKSPEFILPTNNSKETETFRKDFEKTRDKIRKIIAGNDLTLTCEDFSFPGMGKLTKYEWICFVIFHSVPHTKQLKNIHSLLSKNLKTNKTLEPEIK